MSSLFAPLNIESPIKPATETVPFEGWIAEISMHIYSVIYITKNKDWDIYLCFYVCTSHFTIGYPHLGHK